MDKRPIEAKILSASALVMALVAFFICLLAVLDQSEWLMRLFLIFQLTSLLLVFLAYLTGHRLRNELLTLSLLALPWFGYLLLFASMTLTQF